MSQDGIENRITKLEVNIQHIKESLDEIKGLLKDAATKKYVDEVLEAHKFMCPVRKEYLAKEDMYDAWIACMNKYTIEKANTVNRLARFVKNVLYLIAVITSASVLFSAGYYFIMNSLKGG